MITFTGTKQNLYWVGSPRSISWDEAGQLSKLKNTADNCFVVLDHAGRIGVANAGELNTNGNGLQLLGMVAPMTAEQLGDPTFRRDYQLKHAYKTGAMANGIASEALVIAMGKAGLLGSFGAAGLVPNRVEQAINTIQDALKTESYAFNLIHSPNEPALEEGAVKHFLSRGVRVVEASAFLSLTINIVHYRVAGLSQDAAGNVQINNRVIAKISRKEVASHFMQPAPKKYLDQLLADGKITALQAQLAAKVPMADDITVEADSGGHTDNRPLVALLPSIIRLRDELQEVHQFETPIRIGAAGGISTPESALSAFMMGAAYIVTGSVNQACVEAGTSEHVRKLLANVSQTDVMMAPASDMFEMGVELQVLKRGTLFGPRAKKLYEFYTQYNSIDEIPQAEREKLEKQTFKKPLEEIWQGCIEFFQERDPHQIERALNNPKRKMALIFRWYLGLSSNWANAGVKERVTDMQIWCGPAMGAFNDWAKGTYLEAYENRVAADIAGHIMDGAAYLYRVQALKTQGINLPSEWASYTPKEQYSPSLV
ncbi:PfaD family polyunsaturated fatty acid/polyketide biosynthesis protein [Aureispira anguillae]|uniref:PfaD family polyunsaturated fatty acid/polyketide biosynthesis protein n=1 Tax=Aureispira anguillae TaxID=2864201 RepID=A0A915YDM6_9BACT|nr:PfaD family polyunsaturated fatty acid/polyketide biosynthesis protein [Aureispira anguillae]BDS11130.1 PfaD family polyunsaturated fatty acid/polyketide biosynthesis protein [Aureispira anguillae]